MSQINGSVIKAFQILSLLNADRRELSAAVLAEKFGFNAVTSHRFLRTLEAAGALVHLGKGSYGLGYLLADLGQQSADEANLSNVIQPALELLTKRIGEGSMATVFDGEMAVCIAKAVPDRPLFVDIKKGSRLEAYRTAHGKMWLAHMPAHNLERYLDTVQDGKFIADTSRTREDFLAELDEVRREGVSYNRGERESDIHGIAVPVLSRTGKMVCGLSVFGSASRFPDPVLRGFIEPLEAAAQEIRQRLYGAFAASEPASPVRRASNKNS